LKPCEWEKRLFEFSQISWYDGHRVVNYPVKENGELVFTQYRSTCHGPDAAGGALRLSLLRAEAAAQLDDWYREVINNGRTGAAMPAWRGILSEQEIEDVVAWIRSKQ
jgi:mono/diheme cytochrome c family protein